MSSMELDLNYLPANLTSLVLDESAESASTLTMEFEGFLPTMESEGATEPNTGLWLGYHTPVSLRRGGTILFHGKVTSYSHSNDAGRRKTSVTVTDALWLLDHIPFSAQVAEIIENAKEGSVKDSSLNVRQAANVYMQTWESVAASLRVEAPGWTAGEDASDEITLDVSQANYSLGAYLSRDKVITAWGALTRMHQANPDALFHMEPNGTIRVVSISKAPTLQLNSDFIPIFSASEISPLYENAVTAVAVVVTAQWTKADREQYASAYAVYPENADLTQSGIKIFTATANSKENVQKQLRYVYGQACAYYNAVNTLQWGGSITLSIERLGYVSPLMHRIDLSGTGAAAHWGAMQAIVTAVSWDFISGTATLTLGMQIQDPELSTLEFEDVEVPGKDHNGGIGSNEPFPGWDSPESSEEGPIWTWATHREDSEESETENLSTDVLPGTGSGSGKGSGKGSDKPGPGSDKPGPGPTPTPGSDKGSDTPPKEDTDTDTDTDTNKGSGNKGSGNKGSGNKGSGNKGSEKPPTGSGNKGSDKPSPGSDKPSPGPGEGSDKPSPGPGEGSDTPGPGEGSDTPGGGSGGCECGPRLDDIEKRLDDIETRLNAIDGKGDPSVTPGPGPNPGPGGGTDNTGTLAALQTELGNLQKELGDLQKQLDNLQKTVDENGRAEECNCAQNILTAKNDLLNAIRNNKIHASGHLVVPVEATATGTITANVSWSINPDSANATIGYPDGGFY